jgi:hypothetical protein
MMPKKKPFKYPFGIVIQHLNTDDQKLFNPIEVPVKIELKQGLS